MFHWFQLGLFCFLQSFITIIPAFAFQFGMSGSVDTSKVVYINDGVLSIDGQPAPLIYGAEIQYFRLRGGPGKNIARKVVVDLWNKILDQAVDAGVNAVSITIPWDFHEYAEGKFDFDGTVDEDGDGNPDYPSRDIKTFFRLLDAHNIKIVVIKPGPYIKFDWGYSGIGAVPLWFHQKYPEAHMMSIDGLKNKLFDYNDDNFQAHIKSWFQALYREVVVDQIGVGKAIKFIQLDNEANYAGQSIMQIDYSPKSIRRYQNYLKDKYHTIDAVNRIQSSSIGSWDNIRPPGSVSDARGKLHDWYDYLDTNSSVYLEKLRKIWESFGVDESQIMFITAENYSGSELTILPNNLYRNTQHRTGLMTLNLYPKTYNSYEDSLLNFPFKVDFDIKNASTWSQGYLGNKNQWVMGSEIEFGWKKNIAVNELAKKQIYLGALGQGMKAFFIQHFADGWNWQWEWLSEQVQEIKNYLKITNVALTEEQWSQIQAEFEKRQFTGINVKAVLASSDITVLNYDGALDINGNPKQYFQFLKNLGQKIIRPFGFNLSIAKSMDDSVAIWRDSTQQAPNFTADISSATLSVNWSSGLLAMLIHSDVQATFAMKGVDYSPLNQVPVIFSIDGGSFDANAGVNVLSFLKRGGVWVNFLGVSLLRQLNYSVTANRLVPDSRSISVNYTNIILPAIEVPVLDAPIYTYVAPSNCRNFMTWKGKVISFICNIEGGTFIQLGAILFEDFNADNYASPSLSLSKHSRIAWFEELFRQHPVAVANGIMWSSDAQSVSAVSRIWRADKKAGYWVTLRNADRAVANIKIMFPKITDLIEPGTVVEQFQVTEVMSGNTRKVSLKDLKDLGTVFVLPAQGSEAISITPVTN